MPRSLPVSTLASVLGLALAMAGCADDDVSVYTQGPTAPMANMGGCTFDPGGAALFDGIYDVAVAPSGYTLGLVVVNQLQQRGGSGRAEPNGVHIQRAEITLEGLDGQPLALPGLNNPFSTPTAGFIPPAADSQSPGSGVVSVEVVPVGYRDALNGMVGAGRTTIVANIRLFGETNGTIDIETGDYQWPIELCAGCLYRCLTDPMATSEYACLPGQDAVSQVTSEDEPGLCP